MKESIFVVLGEESASALRMADLSKTPVSRQSTKISLLNFSTKALSVVSGAPKMKLYLAGSPDSFKAFMSMALTLNYVLKELLDLLTTSAEAKYGGAMSVFYVTQKHPLTMK